MDAITLFREWNRMCTAIKHCEECPLGSYSGCLGEATPEVHAKLLKTVEKWAAENPQRTILQDFLEKHPDAPMDVMRESPTLCPHQLGYPRAEKCIHGVISCKKCWNRPLEEETEAEK